MSNKRSTMKDLVVGFIFWASAWISFRMLYGGLPPHQGKLLAWLSSDARARWSLLGSVVLGALVARTAKAFIQTRVGDPLVARLFDKGFSHHSRGEMPQALEAYRNALHLYATEDHIDAAPVWASIGKVYFDLNEMSQAKKHLTKAMGIYDGFPLRYREERDVTRRLLEIIRQREQLSTSAVVYRDHKFSFEIPPAWVKQPLVPEFVGVGGRIAISHSSYAASFQVSAGTLDKPEWTIPEVRASSAEDFLRTMKGRVGEIEVDTTKAFAGEPNAVVGECDTRNLVGGSLRQRRNGFISLFHGGTEYVIQWSAEPRLEPQVRHVLSSFTLFSCVRQNND